MRRTHLVLPLALVTLMACQSADDPVAPTTTAPSLGATNIKILQPFFIISDADRAHNYTHP